MRRPVVIYIERETSSLTRGLENTNRGALAAFLKIRFGTKVTLFEDEYDFEEHFEDVSSIARSQNLVLFIVSEREFSAGHIHVIKLIQENFSNIPIMLIEHYNAEKLDVELGEVKRFSHHTEKGVVEYLESIIEPKRECDWLGGRSFFDREMLLEKLPIAYARNVSDDDLLGTPDINHCLVAEALRIKLFPPELVISEFDEVIGFSKSISSVRFEKKETQGDYEEQIERIKNMSDDERKKFVDEILAIGGLIRQSWGGFYKSGVGMGSNVWGFAMDTKFFESTLSKEFGYHGLVTRYLFKKLSDIYVLKGRCNSPFLSEEEEQEIWRTIVKGFIYHKVPNFKTPILIFNNHDSSPTDVFLVANRILSERKFIPLLPSGYIPTRENLYCDFD